MSGVLEINNNSGIYRIINLINNKFYIGSAINLRIRRNGHFHSLNKNKHSNKFLQNSYNKYGKENFIFMVIEYCNQEILQEREQYYLDLYWSFGLYNTFRTAYSVSGKNHPMFGKTHSNEARLKIKEARSNQIIKHSQETKNKIAKGNQGKFVSIEHISNMVKARNGKAWNKGLKTGFEPKNKIKFTQEQIKKIIELYSKGLSINGIKREFNYDWDTIKNLLKSQNIKIRNISQQKRLTDGRNK